MMTTITATMLSEGAKVGAKVGSKVLFGVAGSLAGFGLSQAVMPKMRKSMDKYMESEKFQSLTPEEQQAEINWYNIEATAVNGLCNAVGAVAASLADLAVCKTIDNSKISNTNSFTIGTDFRI